MSGKKPWYGTKNNLKELAQKHTSDELAEMFSVRLKTVHDSCRAFGISARSKYAVTTEILVAALKKKPNMTMRELHEATGVPISTISVRVRNNEITIRKVLNIKPLDVKEVAEMCKTMSITQMHPLLNVGFAKLSAFIKKHGLTPNSRWADEAVRTGKIQHWTRQEKHAGKCVVRLEPNVIIPKASVLSAKETIWPESVKIQVIKRPQCNDWRNAMNRQPLSSHKEISWRY